LREDAARLLPPQFIVAIDAEEAPSVQGIFDYEADRISGTSTALIGDAAFVVRPLQQWAWPRRPATSCRFVRIFGGQQPCGGIAWF